MRIQVVSNNNLTFQTNYEIVHTHNIEEIL